MADLKKHKFDMSEAAGSLGDLGILLPLMVGMIAINGLNATVTMAGVGVFYILAGLYFHLPMPVEPFKVIAAIAIAQGLSPEIISAGAMGMAAMLLFLAATNLITPIAKLFRKPVVRGIQLGLGLTLLLKAGSFIVGKEMFLSKYAPAAAQGVNLNLIIGIAGFLAVLLLIDNKKLPAAMVLVAGGIAAGIALGALDPKALRLGFAVPQIGLPSLKTLGTAMALLALPQIPLTIGNAVISTSETAKELFGKEASARATPRALCLSMGMAASVFGFLGGMPCCHGAGGLAAHYRFGARTGGSNIIIGSIFVILALLFGKSALPVLTLIPLSILGVLLAFAGLELSLMVIDLKKRTDLFLAFAIAVIAVVTKNMGIAFVSGIIIERITARLKIEI